MLGVGGYWEVRKRDSFVLCPEALMQILTEI